jgi:hypothetical protein
MLAAQNLRRLALIKFLFMRAVELSKQAEPARGLAVLGFHDAVELTLHLACEHLQVVVPPKTEFGQYWKLLAAKGPVTQEGAMARLNRARVALKHHGNLPSSLDVESFRATANEFFQENCPTLFGQSFDSVSLIDLVACEPTRNHLRAAGVHYTKGDAQAASQSLALSFATLLADYEDRKRNTWGGSPFFIGESMTFLGRFNMSDEVDGRLADFVDATSKSITALQNAMKVLAMGLDYRKYARFRALTPTVITYADGGTTVQEFRERRTLSKEDFEFCSEYVLESAITLQGVDYDLP